jgi:FkbM family methyltransferase
MIKKYILKWFHRVKGVSGLRESFALDRLDEKIEPFVRGEKRVFVEAGAFNGITQSNTLYFERYEGWTGILVEPIPKLAKVCRRTRPDCIVENVALVSDEYADDTVEMEYCGLMSIVKGGLDTQVEEQEHLETGSQFLEEGDSVQEVTVPARTLSGILDDHGVSDFGFLSLDVEGYEAEALQGLDLERHRPKYILVEARSADSIKDVISDYYRHDATLAIYDHRKDMLFKRRT